MNGHILNTHKIKVDKAWNILTLQAKQHKDLNEQLSW